MRAHRSTSRASIRGFTLIELILVIVLIGIIFMLAGFRTGTFSFWREEGFLRKLSETIQFLHYQAVTDQAFYRLEFDFDKNTYRIGILKAEGPEDSSLDVADESGNLTRELTFFLNPSISEESTLIPPPSFPSLAEPQPLPAGVTVESVKVMRKEYSRSQGGTIAINFSPRGFTDFSVIHLKMSNGSPITFLVNPFTGAPEIYREYKDFEWSYGRKGKKGGR